MTGRIGLAGVVVALAVAAWAEGGAPGRPASRVTVMSFNILQGGGNAANVGFPNSQFGGSRYDDLARVIRAAGADVVGVQEDDRSGRLLKELGKGWHRAGTVYSRLPVTAIREGAFLSVARVRLPSGSSLVIVNTHWWPRRGGGPFEVQRRVRTGTVPADREQFEREILKASDATAGRRGYKTTVDVIAPLQKAGERVIVTGDFNEPSHLDWTVRAAKQGMDRWVHNPTARPLRFKIAWQGSRLMTGLGLRDAYRTVYPNEVAKPGITWTPPYPKGTPGRRPYADQVLDRIDMIYFAGRGVKAVSAAVVGESAATCELAPKGPWPSDHRAVVATFQLTPDPKAPAGAAP